MTMDTIRVWTRREIEEAAAIEPEGATMLRLLITPRMLKLLMDYYSATSGQRVELLSAYGDPTGCELRLYKRDGGAA